MSVDKSGTYWRGSTFADLCTYLREYAATGYPISEILQSVCACGHSLFSLEGDQEEACVRRICTVCGVEAFIGDSAEHWNEARPVQLTCSVCDGTVFEVGVGFSFWNDRNVNWITLGERCARCDGLGSFTDWKIDYAPTEHLLRSV